ncbi:RNA polymerase sigma factor [Polaribacter sp.]|uniref:RNA polymerase sigma factor n=1 Tax=Polaribacter sp. TaxID=1920175 RepID=UPI004047B7E4
MAKDVTFLILECKRNNKKAQIQIYDLFCENMFFTAFKYLKNEDEAKDVIQDSFLKAFLSLESFEIDSSFGLWLKKIVINTCIDKLKKRKIETISLENYSIEILDDDLEDWNFDATINKETILKAIEKLDLKYQLVIKLFLFEGYDHSEIAEILNIPIKTSRTQLKRGKLLLRNILKP